MPHLMQFYGTGIILHIAVIILNLHDETDTLQCHKSLVTQSAQLPVDEIHVVECDNLCCHSFFKLDRQRTIVQLLCTVIVKLITSCHNNFGERPHRRADIYGDNYVMSAAALALWCRVVDFFCSVQRNSDSPCFSMGRTTPKHCPFPCEFWTPSNKWFIRPTRAGTDPKIGFRGLPPMSVSRCQRPRASTP